MSANTPSFTVTMNDSNDGKQSSQPTPNNYNVDAGNKSIDYILKRNEELDKENRELREEMRELSNKLEEEESFNDKNDKRINEMKGLTKNLVESKLIMEAIINDKDLVSKNYNDNLNKNNNIRSTNDNFIMMLCLEISSILLLLGFIHSYLMLIIIVSIFTMNYYFAMDRLFSNQNDIDNNNLSLNKNNEDINARIKKRKLELVRIKNATDFLNDHIDNI